MNILELRHEIDSGNVTSEELFNQSILAAKQSQKEFNPFVTILDKFNKGKLIYENDKWMKINITRNECDISNINIGQKVLIVIGENINKEKIEKLFN